MALSEADDLAVGRGDDDLAYVRRQSILPRCRGPLSRRRLRTCTRLPVLSLSQTSHRHAVRSLVANGRLQPSNLYCVWRPRHLPGRILFCGDRLWNDIGVIRRVMEQARPDVVIEGEARGADTLARIVAEQLGIPVEGYALNSVKHGKSASYMRNREMVRRGQPDRVIAFHDALDRSKGTKDLITVALGAQIPITLVHSDGKSEPVYRKTFEKPASGYPRMSDEDWEVALDRIISAVFPEYS